MEWDFRWRKQLNVQNLEAFNTALAQHVLLI